MKGLGPKSHSRKKNVRWYF